MLVCALQVGQKRAKNLQTRVMHFPSCCFAYKTYPESKISNPKSFSIIPVMISSGVSLPSPEQNLTPNPKSYGAINLLVSASYMTTEQFTGVVSSLISSSPR